MIPNKAAEAGLSDVLVNLSCLTNRGADEFRATVHPRICLLGADYLNSNLGIRALTTGAITAIFAQHAGADVQILEYGAASREFIFELPETAVRVQMLNMRFSKQLWVQNHIARLIGTAVMLKVVPSRLRVKLLARNLWLRELTQADYVLALSGGDSFSDIYGLRRFFYMSLPQILVLLLGKKLIQLPQTIGPFKRSISRRVARWILSRSALVYSRDEEAVPQIRSLIPGKQAERVRFCPDLGFVVPAKVPARIDPQLEVVFSRRPVVGFNVSGLLYMGGYTRKNMFGLASDYKALVHRAIRHFIEVKNATVLLVPHLLWPRGEGDIPAAANIASELKHLYSDRLFTVEPTYDEREVKSVIERCDFFVGARMHACIAALSQCVPTVAMAYSGKFLGVLKSVGMDSAVADLRCLSIEEVLALLDWHFDQRALLRTELQTRMPRVSNSVFGLMKEITSIGNLFGDAVVEELGPSNTGLLK